MNYHFCCYIEKKQRVDMYISALFPHISRSYIQKLIDSGSILVNKSCVKKNLKIEPKSEICIREIIIKSHILPQNIPLDIVYENNDICIVNKDPGINVHPTPGIEGKKGTMVNAVLYHCKNELPIISGEERPGVVHRLDKDTSGLIMFAKNDLMMGYLSDIIRKRNIKKYYIAIVVGVCDQKNFTIHSKIGRSPSNPIKMTTVQPLNPKDAVTHGEVISYIDERYSVVKIDLETGRTHQIRVHMADIGFPILGDQVYGDKDMNIQAQKKYGLERQALHAYKLEFDLYGEIKSFYAELKDDMKALLPEGFDLKSGILHEK